MSWRSAFLKQAKCDYDTRAILNAQRAEYCQQLHYLQMATEKLAKGFLTSDSTADPPDQTHTGFVRCLQIMKGRRDIRRQLRFQGAKAFAQYIDSLLPLAEQVQRLAPNFAGTTNPNPEYQWQPSPGNAVVPPVDYPFLEFDPRHPQMIKLLNLLRDLIRVIS